jgi:hypothetical protein
MSSQWLGRWIERGSRFDRQGVGIVDGGVVRNRIFDDGVFDDRSASYKVSGII